ncbi:hypothetical protein WSK_2384 [Novosphingobium sp. Rr 2-17]|uniref:hypothetical protein n=1 Tax=Novosphingobium sp. Rr 2-17 TaxID=555793 RepID=UPI000269A50F|nr:hypothetical protein [Novosphingobium sp. Rr 2-17]EIZ78841.1 hypothetical protein WSK_2384 [Novosphingobium sp. Rr 2-17]
MILPHSLFVAESLVLIVGIVALTAAFAAIMPMRWGWTAFPVAFLASLFTAALVIHASIEALYQDGGGFVVHFNMLHLAGAGVLSAIAFWSVKKARRVRTND